MRSRAVGVFALFLIAFSVGSFPRAIARQAAQAEQVQDVPEYGPAKGTLVIIGGGETEGTGTSIENVTTSMPSSLRRWTVSEPASFERTATSLFTVPAPPWNISWPTAPATNADACIESNGSCRSSAST